MKNEKLLRAMGQIDDGLISDAAIQPGQKKRPFYGTPAFRRIVAIAVCFVLVAGFLLYKPRSSGPHPDTVDPSTLLPPAVQGDSQRITISGLDQLNYYAAVRVIAGTPMPTVQSASCGRHEITLLTTGSSTDEKEEPPMPEITLPAEGETTPSVPAPSKPPVPDEDIYYYALDPNEPFYINKVTMFQIELTDENGFLASKLGLGVVDVVITEECIWGESLLTFRRGENFYSCLTNGWSYIRETGGQLWDFSTHKYVEGFFIVKNIAQENYGFYIEMDAQGQAIAFRCRESENGGDRVDQNVKVVSSTVISTEGGSFTVAELEDYFNTGHIPEGMMPTAPSQPTTPSEEPTGPSAAARFYTNGEFLFAFDSDGTFVFSRRDGQEDSYRKGTYVLSGGELLLTFMRNGDQVEAVSCPLTEDGFEYNGSLYVKEPTGGLNARITTHVPTSKAMGL
ncbi:MAG: hypothetical protein E7436_00685 [Ruminococcaceae bacterium]|nr:hypothetical protein [Oscillospiraceae bacterium]